MRQFIYTMFISNNRASFNLWWKENLLKHQKISKYYESGCRNMCVLYSSSQSNQIHIWETKTVLWITWYQFPPYSEEWRMVNTQYWQRTILIKMLLRRLGNICTSISVVRFPNQVEMSSVLSPVPDRISSWRKLLSLPENYIHVEKLSFQPPKSSSLFTSLSNVKQIDLVSLNQ